MILNLQVFGAEVTTAKYTFSICVNTGLVAILEITAPHTHGDLSWSTTERRSIEMTGYNATTLPHGGLACDLYSHHSLASRFAGEESG